MFLTRIKGNEMKTQLNLPFNNFKCEHMAMQLAFKSCRVRVRLKETTKGVMSYIHAQQKSVVVYF